MNESKVWTMEIEDGDYGNNLLKPWKTYENFYIDH